MRHLAVITEDGDDSYLLMLVLRVQLGGSAGPVLSFLDFTRICVSA